MNGPGFHVRVARSDELAAAGRIARDAYLMDGLIKGANIYADQLADAASRAAAPGVDVLVAVAPAVDGVEMVAGTITVAEAGSSYADIALVGGCVLCMRVVDHRCRGNGGAQLLTRLAIDLARERDLTSMLSFIHDNVKAARL